MIRNSYKIILQQDLGLLPRFSPYSWRVYNQIKITTFLFSIKQMQFSIFIFLKIVKAFFTCIFLPFTHNTHTHTHLVKRKITFLKVSIYNGLVNKEPNCHLMRCCHFIRLLVFIMQTRTMYFASHMVCKHNKQLHFHFIFLNESFHLYDRVCVCVSVVHA